MYNTRLITALLTATFGAMAGDHKVASDLRYISKHQRVKVIVRWQDHVSARVEDKVRARNGSKMGELSLIHSGLYEMEAHPAI
jgi:hypothetical protein